MAVKSRKRKTPRVGIIGFGAFGQLVARHISDHVEVFAYDPDSQTVGAMVGLGAEPATLETAASCDMVVLAAPVSKTEDVVRSISPHLQPGVLVIDVGSVKVLPVNVMQKLLPQHVEIIATHPLFGPQSAQNGLKGLKIAVCPVRGVRHHLLVWYLKNLLGLEVIVTTPDAHDREAAVVQGLTHLIAKVLTDMQPLPTRMTTRSYDLLMTAVAMVQNDAPEVFDAIERSNPYSKDVRNAFFKRAAALKLELDQAHD